MVIISQVTYVVPEYERMPTIDYLEHISLSPGAHTVEHSLDFHPSGFSLLLTTYTRSSVATMSGNKRDVSETVNSKRIS